MEAIKTTSAAYLIQQVQSRFKINNSNWRADALDWIGLIVEEIGYHTGFEPKEVCVKVRDFKAIVPSEVISIGKVTHNGWPLVCLSDRDSISSRRIGKQQLRLASPEDILALNKESERLRTLQELYLTEPNEEVLNAIQNSQRKVSQIVEGVTFQNRFNEFGCHWYRIEMGKLATSFQEGEIHLDADVYLVDEAGWPMVIDTFKYREACIWGMLYYMMLGGYVHPVLSLQKVESEKDFFIGQARNEPKMMTIDRHQEFTETWSQLNRGINNVTLNRL